MKKGIIGSVAVLVSALIFTACSSPFTIMSDYDKTADFSTFKTYNYLPGLDSLMGPGASRIKSNAEEYMNLLGYQLVDENPDLFISINGQVQQKIGTQTQSNGYNGYNSGYYGGYYGGYNSWDTYTTSYVYNQTTIVIDLLDVKKHQLVWQGAATGEFDQYSMSDAQMKKMVDQIFGQYPYAAGTSTKRALLYGKYYKKPEAK